MEVMKVKYSIHKYVLELWWLHMLMMSFVMIVILGFVVNSLRG